MIAKRTPGVRAGLTREQILDAALKIVDGGRFGGESAASGAAPSAGARDPGGLGALTMRRLGAALGVEAMTIYHYFPTKDALVDGLSERLFTGAAEPVAAAGTWREQLFVYAESLRRALLAHPALLPVIARPAVTPATLDAVESTLGMLIAAGFPLARAVDVLNALTVFVIGHATAEAAIGAPAPPPGLDPERHPLLFAAARSGAGANDYERFRYAIRSLLIGFGPTG